MIKRDGVYQLSLGSPHTARVVGLSSDDRYVIIEFVSGVLARPQRGGGPRVEAWSVEEFEEFWEAM